MLNGLKNIYVFYVERYKKRFIYCFAIYFFLVIIGVLTGILNPELTVAASKIVGSSFSSVAPGLLQAINAGQVATIILTIFGINSIFGTFLTITLPNVVGLGSIIFITRPFLWGIIYAPINPHHTMLLIAVTPTMILEGTAYIIAFVSSIDLFLAIIKPQKLGEESRIKALKKAVLYNLKSYVLVLIVLFVAAVVETVTILTVI
jgi:hypothetical protein